MEERSNQLRRTLYLLHHLCQSLPLILFHDNFHILYFSLILLVLTEREREEEKKTFSKIESEAPAVAEGAAAGRWKDVNQEIAYVIC